MARKKKGEASGGNAPWLATFADLMNLLLCFFVLLFSMSNVDAEKFEQISQVFSSSFSIFSGGGSAINMGQLISSGTNQLNDLDDYFSNMGKSDDGDNDELDENGDQIEKNPEDVEGDNQADNSIESALDKIKDEMITQTEDMYDNISELTGKYNISEEVKLDIDPEYRYVKLSLRGEILFDSGKADLKPQVIPVLSKVGDILKDYKDYNIEIEGHTDNVPMRSKSFKDNNWLSSARALNAAEYFINEKGIDAAKLKYSGRGEYNPVSSNKTAEGRADNRRIEIKIYNELSSK